MNELDDAEQSWAGLILLLGISALLMTVWFVVHPLTALLSTLAGILVCAIVLDVSGSHSSGPDFQADSGET